MAKQPFVKIYANNAMASLLPLSLAGCGAWFKIVLILSQSQSRGAKTMSRQAWARALGVSAEQAEKVINELLAEQAFNFEDNGATLTITSRYMVRETKELEQNRARQEKFITQKKQKNNGKITPKKIEDRNNISPSITGARFSIDEVLEIAGLPDVALGEADARAFYDFYASQDWHKSNGQPLTELAPALRNWKRKRGEFSAKTERKANGRGSLNNPEDYA